MEPTLVRRETDITSFLMNQDLDIAILLPCHNEAAALPGVITGFRKALPQATIYVYDNNSTDGTAEVAAGLGAVVRRETQQGKGHVVRRMFSDIEASVYLLVDGDNTYSAAAAPVLLQTLLDERCDMVNARRVHADARAYRRGHETGNRVLTRLVAWIFGARIRDTLSGYRVFSRRFVKSFPALSTGFEIETELTIHALALHMPVAEVDTPYQERPPKSVSKLHTVRDGFRILGTILLITKEEHPFFFFSLVAGLLAALSVGLAAPVVLTYLKTGLVPRFPTAILAASIMVLAFLALNSGLILSSVARGRRELRRLHYLNLPWLKGSDP
ncbi:MAG: glycosyltransferase family 2 protein [Acidiferrobacteraceae bacterium]